MFENVWELLSWRQYEPTYICQIDDGEENHSSSQWDSQEEQSLKLLSGQSVLQVLQEDVDLK